MFFQRALKVVIAAYFIIALAGITHEGFDTISVEKYSLIAMDVLIILWCLLTLRSSRLTQADDCRR